MITIDQCDFYAAKNRSGQWVGRCRQFPELKTKPRAQKLDAIDLAVAAVRDQLADIDARRPIKPKTVEAQR